jgi:hypothetical protein
MLKSGNGQPVVDPMDMAPTHGRHMLNVQREPGNDLMHWYFRDGSQIDADAQEATVEVYAKGVRRSYAEQCARDIKSLAKYRSQNQIEVEFLDGSHWLIEFDGAKGV